jgi:hypothetical protein
LRARLQAGDEAGERLATMRTAVFLGGVEFGGGPVEFADVEQRIIAKAIVAACCRQNLAVPFAFGDDRLRVVGVTNKNDDRHEMRAALTARAEFGQSSFWLLRASDLGSPA